ncbi:MAG: hypothetical protein LBS98_01995 [Coriobacteriales bacterium]|jgi:predicted ABC-type transport system involved in lysophospholipase L1 biosynthesis ATPase subunit|nr:hypothetical protein [Coriobacteriales bacterium]
MSQSQLLIRSIKALENTSIEYMLTGSEFDQSRFARRQTVELFGLGVKVSSPEDTIVMKLLWAKQSGGSEKQLFDVARIYELQAEILDRGYLDIWIGKLGLEGQLVDMQRLLDG